MSLSEALQNFDVRDWLSEKTRVFKSGPTNVSASACPICGTKGGKFYANASGGLRNGYFTAYCCNNQGSLVSLIALVEDIRRDEAIDLVREKEEGDNVRVIPIVPFEQEIEAPPAIDAPAPLLKPTAAHPCYVKDRWGTIAERGASQYIIERHNLFVTGSGTKFAGDWRKDLDHRLVVPVYAGGELLSWQARDLTGHAKRKYLFPAGDRSSEWLYDLDRFEGDTLLICEGVFHKWAWDALGSRLGDKVLEHCCVASFGKKLTAAQQDALLMHPVNNIIFAWDLDAAPEVGKVARGLNGKKNIYIMPAHPSGRDPDELDDAELIGMWKTVEPYSQELEVRLKTELAWRRMGK